MTVNKGVLEALFKSGSFDVLHDNRAQLMASVELIIDTARRLQEDKASGQGNLFAMNASPKEQALIDLRDASPWGETERLNQEKEVLGLYISGHPLARYEKEIRAYSSLSIAELTASHGDSELSIVGVIHDLDIRRSQKNNKRYGLGILEDLDGTLEILVFSRTLDRHEELLLSGTPLVVSGKIELDGSVPKKMILNNVRPLKDVRREAISAIHIKLDTPGVNDTFLNTLKQTLQTTGEIVRFISILMKRVPLKR